MEALDTVFLFVFGAAMLVPEIAGSFGIEKRYVWAPVLVFVFWTVYIGYYRAKKKFADRSELSLIERIRGWNYGTNLAITLLFNSLTFLILGQSNIITIIVTTVAIVATVGTSLAISAPLLLRSIFQKQVTLFSQSERDDLINVLKGVGGASIYLSVMVLAVQNIIFSDIVVLILVYPVLLLFLLKIYYNEKESRMSARKLSISLEKTRWKNHYERLKKKERVRGSI